MAGETVLAPPDEPFPTVEADGLDFTSASLREIRRGRASWSIDVDVARLLPKVSEGVNIEEFLQGDTRYAVERQPKADALRQLDALQESALVDIRMNFVGGTAWILLDCRGSLHFPEANTAVLVLLGVNHASWQLPATGTSPGRRSLTGRSAR